MLRRVLRTRVPTLRPPISPSSNVPSPPRRTPQRSSVHNHRPIRGPPTAIGAKTGRPPSGGFLSAGALDHPSPVEASRQYQSEQAIDVGVLARVLFRILGVLGVKL